MKSSLQVISANSIPEALAGVPGTPAVGVLGWTQEQLAGEEYYRTTINQDIELPPGPVEVVLEMAKPTLVREAEKRPSRREEKPLTEWNSNARVFVMNSDPLEDQRKPVINQDIETPFEIPLLAKAAGA
jgi:hypothetical protein